MLLKEEEQILKSIVKAPDSQLGQIQSSWDSVEAN